MKLLRKKDNCPEIKIIKSLLHKSTITIVDVGAHDGDFIDQIKSKFSIKEAVLFEPIPECYDKLKRKYTSFTIINKVVKERIEEVDFNINDQKQTSSMFDFLASKELENVNTSLYKKIRLESTTLDHTLNKIESIDVLKVDVQGAEHLVFHGGMASLKKTKLIYVEVSFKKLYANSSDFFDIHTFLSNNGFFLKELLPGHRSKQGEMLQANAIFLRDMN